MNRLRHLAIESYRLATKPLRDCTTARLRKEGQIPLSVLFYHRVANEHPNDWTISRKSFADHLDWLEDNTELVSLEAIQARMVRGHNEAHCAHITFDDGYAENCDFAIPELLSRNIPCTYFVSLDFIQTGRAFPHDAAAGRPLPPNSIDQLREMATAGIEIGAHTRNHPDLGKVTDAGTLYDEVITATRELSDLIGQPIRYFAFPFGLPENLNAHAADLLRDAGIRGICSAFGGYNFAGQDPFHIRRIHGDPEICRLKNWLSVDPRKLLIGRGLEMQRPEISSEKHSPVPLLSPAGNLSALHSPTGPR